MINIMNVVTVIILLVFFVGSEQKRDRIIGGLKVGIKDHPYQLCIYIQTSKIEYTNFKGAAVIVSRRWAFTSGSAVAFIDRNLFLSGFVYLRGNVTRWNDTQHAVNHMIISVRFHPKFETYSRDYNLALVKVKEPFNGRFERPIIVVGKKYHYTDGSYLTIVGWGKVNVNQVGPSGTLTAATIRIMNQGRCHLLYSQGFISPLTPRMLCSMNSGNDSCIYDSGGPVISKNRSRPILVGLMSWARECANSLLPEIYTRLGPFHDWIKQLERKLKESFRIKFVH